MSEQDKTLIGEYSIRNSPKTVYSYKEYRYDRLSDALNYAKSDAKRTETAVESTTPA